MMKFSAVVCAIVVALLLVEFAVAQTCDAEIMKLEFYSLNTSPDYALKNMGCFCKGFSDDGRNCSTDREAWLAAFCWRNVWDDNGENKVVDGPDGWMNHMHDTATIWFTSQDAIRQEWVEECRILSDEIHDRYYINIVKFTLPLAIFHVLAIIVAIQHGWPQRFWRALWTHAHCIGEDNDEDYIDDNDSMDGQIMKLPKSCDSQKLFRWPVDKAGRRKYTHLLTGNVQANALIFSTVPPSKLSQSSTLSTAYAYSVNGRAIIVLHVDTQ